MEIKKELPPYKLIYVIEGKIKKEFDKTVNRINKKLIREIINIIK